MWVEAILLGEDLTKLVQQLLPVDLRLGDGGRLSLRDPSTVSIVPEVGLRVVCKANLHWPVLGIAVPVALHSLDVLLSPEIAALEGGPELVFKLRVTHADLALVPTLIDDRITDKINVELEARHVELTWKMGETLSHAFALPDVLSPLETLSLRAVGARVKVTAEAMGLAILFAFSVTRDEPGVALRVATPSPRPSSPSSRAASRDAGAFRSAAIAAAGVGALVVGGVLALFSLRRR